MRSEHRKGYFLGVTPAEWIIVGLATIAGLIQYGAYGEAIKHNTNVNHEQAAAIEQFSEKLPTQIQNSQVQIRAEIQQAEIRQREYTKQAVEPLREDMREIRRSLRKILINQSKE